MQCVNFTREAAIKEGKMMEHKRSPLSIDQSNLTTFAPKRHKADLSISSKERKEKLSERIGALQQLVSPYGKTDTASVLLEAMEYITFLHEQVKVLSAPYLQSNPTAKMQLDHTACEAKAYVLCQFHVLLELLAAMVQISGPPSRPLHPNSRESPPGVIAQLQKGFEVGRYGVFWIAGSPLLRKHDLFLVQRSFRQESYAVQMLIYDKCRARCTLIESLR